MKVMKKRYFTWYFFFIVVRDILIIYLACKALKYPSDDLEGYILNLVIVLDASPQSKSPEECISATQCYCLKN
jgi:hypothetical protein